MKSPLPTRLQLQPDLSMVANPPEQPRVTCSRRGFFHRLSLGALLFTVPGAFAEELTRKTAWVEEGPFYPPNLPLDTDNDLIIVNDSLTPAVGEIKHVSGRLLDSGGRSQ